MSNPSIANAEMRRLMETMKKLQANMDQRKQGMDDRDAQRDSLLADKKNLVAHLYMYEHWRHVKAKMAVMKLQVPV